MEKNKQDCVIEKTCYNYKEFDFIYSMLGELRSARAKFPSSRLSLAALMEEVGELAQAMLKCRTKEWHKYRVRIEAIQVAVMAMRVALEGDASFDDPQDSEPGEGEHQCVIDALKEC